MNHLRFHFLASYAVAGAIAPFIPQFFHRDRGFDPGQIGLIFAVAQLSVMVAPVALTYFADRLVSPRKLAGAVFTLTILGLAGLWSTRSFGAGLVFYSVYGFAFAAMMPSMDGLFFAVEKKRALDGGNTPPYHRIRVLGTLGFILPSALLLAFIPAGGSLSPILPVAACFALAALFNAFLLPDPRINPPEAGVPTNASRMPTLDAARALFSRRTLPFCLAIALVQIAHMGYFTFYPVHLVNALGVDGRWLGAISTVGVAVEAGMMFGFGWMSRRFGIMNLLLIGILCAALRLVLLAAAQDAWVAIAANLLHGPVILGTMVAPILFINQLAGDSFRNSIQGVFAVAVAGPARIGGNLLSGWLAEYDIRFVFVAGAACAAAAALLIVVSRSFPPANDGASVAN